MDAAPVLPGRLGAMPGRLRTRPPRAGRLRGGLTATVALITLAACGGPAPVQTLANRPDFVRPPGADPADLGKTASDELARLAATCASIDPTVAIRLAAVTPGRAVEHGGMIGDRAVFDGQTRTLYVLDNGRLWYLQLVGKPPTVAAVPAILTALGRALLQSQRTR